MHPALKGAEPHRFIFPHSSSPLRFSNGRSIKMQRKLEF